MLTIIIDRSYEKKGLIPSNKKKHVQINARALIK